MNDIDWRREYSEDEIEQAFGEAFAKPALYNNVSTWEAAVEWDKQQMTVVLEITSMAGDPTKEEFQANEELKTIEATMFNGRKVIFEISEVLTLNGTDYRAIYVPVDEIEEDEELVEELEDEIDEELVEEFEDSDDLTGNVGWNDIAED